MPHISLAIREYLYASFILARSQRAFYYSSLRISRDRQLAISIVGSQPHACLFSAVAPRHGRKASRVIACLLLLSRSSSGTPELARAGPAVTSPPFFSTGRYRARHALYARHFSPPPAHTPSPITGVFRPRTPLRRPPMPVRASRLAMPSPTP